jgi:hypothetical protein
MSPIEITFNHLKQQKILAGDKQMLTQQLQAKDYLNVNILIKPWIMTLPILKILDI